MEMGLFGEMGRCETELTMASKLHMKANFPTCARQPMSLKGHRVPQARLGLVEATDRARDMVTTDHSPRSAEKHEARETVLNVLEGLGEFRREKNKLVQV